MSPTFVKGQSYIVRHYAYESQGPARWDIITFHPFGDTRAFYVLRVVGLPGETVNIVSNRLMINGSLVNMPAKMAGVSYQQPRPLHTNQDLALPYKIPANSYYVLGDNPATANDSRYIGAIPLRNITGKIQD